MKRYLILFLFGLFVILVSCKKGGDNSDQPSASTKKSIYILNTGDIHEMSYFLPKVAHFIKKFREEHENVLVLDAGDRFTWWPTYKLHFEDGSHNTVNTDLKSLSTYGKAILEIMNMISYDAVIFGNHSWAYSIDTLVERINEYNLPMLSCNVIYPPNLPSKNSDIFSFDGVNIGVIGVTTNNYDHVLHSDSLNVASPTSHFVTNELNLIQNNTDLVVLLTHELDQTDEASIYSLNGFDILIGGHSHNALNNMVIGRLMTKAGLAGMYVGVSEIIWDMEKDKLSDFNYYLKYMEEYPYEDAEVKARIDALLN